MKTLFKDMKRRHHEMKLTAKAEEAYELLVVQGKKTCLNNRYSLLIDAKDSLKFGYISKEFYDCFVEKVENNLPK